MTRRIIAVCLATTLTLVGTAARGDSAGCAFDAVAGEMELIEACTVELSAASNATEQAELHVVRGSAYLALAGDDAESISSLQAFWPGIFIRFEGEQSETEEPLTYTEKAIADFDAATEADSRLASAWFYRGYARMRLGDENGGLSDFRRAAELDPETARYLLAVSILLARRGEFRSAREVVNEAIAIDPGNAGQYAVRSLISSGLMDDQGMEDRKRAFELDPENERIQRIFELLDALRQRARDQVFKPAGEP